MPEFLPFIGTRYNPSKVHIENVTAPPFDVISQEYRNLLYDRDAHNVIRLEWSRDADPYDSAARYFKEWKQTGILMQDDRAMFYVYHQVFKKPDGEQVTRSGVIGRIKVSDYAAREVLPHERTHDWPKKDRLELMGHTNANFSPIFGLISDPSFLFDQSLEPATVHAPLADVEETLPSGETVRHLLWRLDDTTDMERISRIVRALPVIIADGHHRYETAVAFNAKHPDVMGGDYIMMFISNLQSEGAVILPTHRLLHDVVGFNQYHILERLRKRFEIVMFTSREEGMAELERDDDALTLIEFAEDPKWVLLRDIRVRERDFIKPAAERLEEEIFMPLLGLSRQAISERVNLLYPHTLRELDEMEEEQAWDAAFLLRAVRPSELQSVVERGEFMPQKTTYFFPKLLTGLVFHEFGAQMTVPM
jgi:uncharacterized protein (DUF1015 family)